MKHCAEQGGLAAARVAEHNEDVIALYRVHVVKVSHEHVDEVLEGQFEIT